MNFIKKQPNSGEYGRMTRQTPILLAQQSDDFLLTAIGGRDRQAAAQAGTELVRRHLSYIVYICQQKLGNAAEAEEAAQDVFISVWKKAGDWQSGHAKVTTWLYRIAVNRCIDIIRRRKPTSNIDAIAEPADEREDIEAAQMVADRNRQLRAALDVLSDDQRRAIELVYYGETKQSEAAAQLGITLAALESLLRRARAKLNDELSPMKEYLEPVK